MLLPNHIANIPLFLATYMIKLKYDWIRFTTLTWMSAKVLPDEFPIAEPNHMYLLLESPLLFRAFSTFLPSFVIVFLLT